MYAVMILCSPILPYRTASQDESIPPSYGKWAAELALHTPLGNALHTVHLYNHH
jgi:hypothetical protein